MTPEILLADDDTLIALSLATYSEDEGLRVTHAGSTEALARVSAGERCQVCTKDICLPGMDGSRAIVKLHRIDPWIQFLIHTGSSDYSPPARLRVLGVGPERLFRKPLADVSPLARTVHAMADAKAVP
jgi:two-component system, OmpR family, response regulator